jgi:hypothetical protein
MALGPMVPLLGTVQEVAANIGGMDSPRSGFRKAAVTSWALAGIGIAGVAGASALAYADTVKPPPAAAPADVDQTPAGLETTPASQVPPAPVITTTDAPPPPQSPEAPPTTTVDQAPVRTYTPEPTYTPESPVQQAPTTHQTPAPTTQRRALTPTTVMAPNFSPRISRSRGS